MSQGLQYSRLERIERDRQYQLKLRKIKRKKALKFTGMICLSLGTGMAIVGASYFSFRSVKGAIEKYNESITLTEKAIQNRMDDFKNTITHNNEILLTANDDQSVIGLSANGQPFGIAYTQYLHDNINRTYDVTGINIVTEDDVVMLKHIENDYIPGMVKRDIEIFDENDSSIGYIKANHVSNGQYLAVRMEKQYVVYNNLNEKLFSINIYPNIKVNHSYEFLKDDSVVATVTRTDAENLSISFIENLSYIEKSQMIFTVLAEMVADF